MSPLFSALVAGIFVPWATPQAAAQPLGGQVVQGAATITTPSLKSTLITQSSAKAIINWQQFSLANGQSVQFKQPDSSAITLNRVTGGTLSTIEGSITSNGQVWLINPNGVLFGSGAAVNVGGLLATTSDIANGDFLSGNYNFSGAPAGSAVVNKGVITTGAGGSVVLSAPRVSNKGVITAHAGHVVLGGADAFTVDFNGDHLLSYAVKTPGDTASVSGPVLMTQHAAAQVQRDVVNNSGMTEATSAHVENNGDVVLDGGDSAAVTNSGTVDVSARAAGQTGGTVEIQGKSVAVTDGAKIDASGDAGGGMVLIGGNFHGAGPQMNAQTTTVGKAVITADAVTNGTGGNVAIWSNTNTKVAATISAKGGARSGNGGQVETSGGTLQVANNASVTTTAANGADGTWLLDPGTINISTSGATALGSDNGYTIADDNSTTDTVTIAPSTIVAGLANGNVVLEAHTTINVNNDVIYNSSHNLVMLSQGTLSLNNAAIQNSGSGAITLTAGWGGNLAEEAGGQALGGDFGLNNDGITMLGQNVALGSASGATYLNAYGLDLQDNGAPHYAQVGYHGAGGGDINILMLGGGVTLNESYGGVTQIGNGGYDGTITGAVTGNITISTGGATTVSTTSGTAVIGNYAGASYAETGNVSLTTGSLASSGVTFDAEALINKNIGGGDVYLATTAATAATTINALSYNSPHNITLSTNNAFNITGDIANTSTGSLTFASALQLGDTHGITLDGGSFNANSAQGDMVFSGLMAIAGTASFSADAGSLAVTGSGNVLGGPVNAFATGTAISINNGANLTLGVVQASNPGAITITTTNFGNMTLAGQMIGGNITLNSAGDITEISSCQIMSSRPTSDATGGLVTLTAAGNINLPGSNSIQQADDGTVETAPGQLSFSAAYNVTVNLANPGMVAISGSAGNNGGAVQIGLTGSYTLSNATTYSGLIIDNPISAGSTVTLTADGDITQTANPNGMPPTAGTITAASLSVTSMHGNITLPQALTVSGPTDAFAYGGAVALTSASNALGGTVSAYAVGGSFGGPYQIEIDNAQTLTLGSVTVANSGTGTDYGSVGITATTGNNTTGDINLTDNLWGGGIQLNAAGNVLETGNGNIWSHHTGGDTISGGLTMNVGGSITLLSPNNIIEQADNPSSPEFGDGELNFSAGGSASIVVTGNNVGLFGVYSNGDVSIAVTGTHDASNYANLDLYNPISTSGRVTLEASGSITQMVDPSRDVSITTPVGLTATADNGNLVLNDGGNGVTENNDSMTIDLGNRIGGLQTVNDVDQGVNIDGYTILNSTKGDASFTNTMDTILGGPAYYNTGSTPSFPYSGTVNAPPDGYNSPDSYIGGTLNVTVTNADEAEGHNAVLVLAGRIHAENQILTQGDTGITTLHAAGDLDNNNGAGTIDVGLNGANNNLVMISDYGNIGGNDGTSWSFGDGADQGPLNLQAIATNGGVLINPGDISFGVTGMSGYGVQAQSLTVFGNGIVAQDSTYGVLDISGNIDIRAQGDITLTDAANTVFNGISLTSPGAISFTNSVDTYLNRANGGGLDDSDNPNVSGNVTIVVHDPSNSTSPSLILGNSTDYDEGNSPIVSSINSSGAVSLTADGLITDGYDPNNVGIAGFITAASLSATSNNDGISLQNPVNNITFDGENPVTLIAAGDIVFTNSQGILLDVYTSTGAFNIVTNDANSASHSVIEIAQASAPGGSGYSLLHASGDIYNEFTPGPGIQASGLALVSDYGSVGTIDSPIQLSPIENDTAQLVQAQAAGDVYLESFQGLDIQNLGLTDFSGRVGVHGITAGGAVGITITNGGNGNALFQSGDSAITATSLTIDDEDTAGSDVTLNNNANLVTGLVQLTGQGNVFFVNGAATLLGTSTGNTSLQVLSYGNLTIDTDAVLTSYGNQAGAVTLETPNFYFINNAGAGAINLPNGGTFNIYSYDPSGDTFNNLNSNNGAIWGQTYVSDLVGNRYIFQTTPTLTITTTNVTKAQDSDDATSLVAGAYIVTGLQGVAGAFQDSYSGIPSVTSTGAAPNNDKPGSQYAITAMLGSLVLPSGYNFAADNAGVLTIAAGKPVLLYVANPFTRTYGSANPVFTGIVTGFQGNDNQQNATTGTLTFSSAATMASGVGRYAILGSGLSSNTYQLEQATTNYTALTINAALLSYVAGNTGRTYGAANPFFSGTVTGFVNGDTQANATTGTLTFTSSAAATSGVGSYGVYGSGLNAANYSFVQAAGNSAALVINPATLNASLTGTISKTYDGTAVATLASSNYALAGILFNDVVGLKTPTTGAYDNANVGAGKQVTANGLSLAGSDAANYVLASSTISGMIGQILTAPSTVLGGNQGLIVSVSVPPTAPVVVYFSAPLGQISNLVSQVVSATVPTPANPDTSSQAQTFEPPTQSDTAVNYIADSMNGGSSTSQASVIIPGVLTAQSGQQQPPPPGTGDDLSSSGNSSLWE